MPSEKGLLAYFYLHPVELKKRSREEGRPIFEDREYIKILIIGQPQSEVARPASPEDKRRFAAEYDAFKRGNVDPNTGTPLENLAGMTPARAAEYKRSEIHTVEQLAEINDATISNLSPGTRALRDRARMFIEDRKAGVQVEDLRNENRRLTERLEEMEKKLGELANDRPERRRRGRPRKTRVDSGEHETPVETTVAAD